MAIASQGFAVLAMVLLWGCGRTEFATLQVSTPAGTRHEMVLVPGGVFTMGLDPAQMRWLAKQGWWDEDQAEQMQREQPAHTVHLDSFYIDRYEVSKALYRAFAEAEGRPLLPGAASGRPEEPVVEVTWFEARAYCQWAGLRLPTEAEWEKAARGSRGRIYPWGRGIDRSKANYGRDERRRDEVKWRLMPVGSYPEGISSCGAYDMSGNVWEWVADWYDSRYYSSSPERNPAGPDSVRSAPAERVVRGGGWMSWPRDLRASHRSSFPPDRPYADLGFRCARSGEGPAAGIMR